jgi:hypothetical protein
VTTSSYAARSATTSTGTASLKLNRDPLGSPFLNDLADATAVTSTPPNESVAAASVYHLRGGTGASQLLE